MAGQIKVTDNISGKGLIVIQAAIPIILEKKYKIDSCKLWVMEDEESYVVSIVDEKAKISPSQRGSPEGFPIYEVEIRKTDLKVIRSHYAR